MSADVDVFGHGAGHVRHAVEDTAVHREGGIRVGRRTRVFEASALVDGDVDEHAAGPHARHHVVRHELRRLRAGDEHRADHEVGVDDGAVQVERVGCRGLDAPLEVVVEVPQALDVGVEDRDVGAHADGDHRGVGAGDAAADDGDARGARAGHARHQQPQPAGGAHQRRRADGRREAAGDLGHRREERQAAAGELHGLVGDRGDAVRDEPIGERAVGGEVQVGEEHEVVTEVAVFARDRLLDLEQQLGARPHLGGVVEERRPGGLVLGIRHGGAEARPALHEDLMARCDQVVNARGRQRHAVLVVLHFGGDADPHRVILSAPPLERSRSLWERL